MPTLSANGATLYYEESGAGDRAVLLLAGGGAPLSSWVRYRALLSPHLRVIAMDNRDVGRSSSPRGFTIADMADDAAAVLDHAGVDTAAVVGVSLGGAIAQELALRHSRRVGRLVLISTFPQTGTEAGPFLRPIWDLCDALEAAGLGAHRGRVMALSMASRKTLANEAFTTQFIAMVGTVAHPARQIEALRSFNVLDRLPSIRCPTLVLVGAEDVHTTPRQARLIAQAIPGARLEVLPDAGHLILHERSDEVSRLLLEMLVENRAPGA